MENDNIETKVLDSMYHRIQNYSLPCKTKRSFESTACEQLLACDVNENHLSESDPFSVTLKNLKKQNAKLNQDANDTKQAFAPFCVSEIINQLDTHGENGYQQEISGWTTCPIMHFTKVPQVSTQDTNTYFNNKSATYLSTFCLYKNTAKNASIIRTQSAGSAAKKSRHSKGCCRTSDEGLWIEPPPPMSINYVFKHYKYPRQYVIQYREKYTYKKLKERLSLIKHFVTFGGSIPKAHFMCVDSRQGIRGVTPGSKSECERIVESLEQAIHEKNESEDSNQRWNLLGHLNGRCDPTLTVNNPSPTEIATLAKMPTVRRSSSSIPSNSNGRFGLRGTQDGHYPFQLNISVESCTITNPVRKNIRGVITH